MPGKPRDADAELREDLERPRRAPTSRWRSKWPPAGGGAVFDVKIDDPGLYPFVSHAFAHVELGQVGLLKVGEVEGTMGH